MKNVKYLLIPIFMVLFIILIVISIFVITPIVDNKKKTDMKKEMFMDIKNNIPLFNGVLDELENYEYIHFEKETSIIKVMYHDENGQKQKLKITTSNDDFKKTSNILKKFTIDEIIKTDKNVIFRYKKISNSIQSIIYIFDKKSFNNSGYDINNLEQIVDKWYYHEQ